jgi:hypothetical protein
MNVIHFKSVFLILSFSTLLMTQINNWVNQTLKTFRGIKKINFSFSVLFSLLGFFCGNLCATFLGSVFDWNGLSAFFVVLSIEIIGLVEYNPVNRDNQVFQYFGVFKRGFFFGLLADGFKVGS